MDNRRESQAVKDSLETWIRTREVSGLRSNESYDEYLMAMKRAHQNASAISRENMSARARHRTQKFITKTDVSRHERDIDCDLREATHISTIASMVPDEIIYNHCDYSIRTYETALMFIDVSGFTDLCEAYTKAGRGGPSKLTQVLNSYIGAMTQEILTHNGDVLKFSGDAFLSMWKKTSTATMQDVVHTAIDCGLIIQKNYGTHVTDLGIKLKVKVAISAGLSHFGIIGDETMASYVLVGQPVWEVKAAEYISTAGDVLTSASAWMYVNEAEYCTQPCGDGKHTKVLGVGLTWKRVEKLVIESTERYSRELTPPMLHPNTNFSTGRIRSVELDLDNPFFDNTEMSYREYSLRPAVISALRSTWWSSLRRFTLTPVLRAVDNDEPMDFLTEVRHVVVVFINIITKTITEDVLIRIVDRSYQKVCRITSESAGLVNKVSMFDKDMMFLVVFGLRGLKYEDEAQKALLCACQIKETVQDPNFISVSIGVTSGRTYCGVVGHVLRREYTVIGPSVNKAARLMVAYQNKVTCDKETFVRSKLDLDFFRLMEPKRLKGIEKPGPIYEFNNTGWPDRISFLRHPILGRNEEMRKFKQVLLNAMNHQQEAFTKYRDMQYGIIILGPRMVGKTRLMEEFFNMTPTYMRLEKIILTEDNMENYHLIRVMLRSILLEGSSDARYLRTMFENRIRYSLSMTQLVPLQIHAANVIFDVRFPLPEHFTYSGDLLGEPNVKELIRKVFKPRNQALRVIAVKDGLYIDDNSWRILLILMETKDYFVIIALNDYEKFSPIAKQCAEKDIFVKIILTGLDRWCHAALACQLLDVQAIPADLEKVMESASGGLPGWIQNFVISLIQRGEMTVVTVPRSEAVEAGAVLPSHAMLQRTDDDTTRDVDVISYTSLGATSFQSYSSVLGKPPDVNALSADNENIQMAVLAENYNFDDMEMDMTMDVIILKTYDSLTPFEKMLLKCGSVLGDIFSRRMLLHLLQGDAQRKVALAVAKLFEIRVLECEGGDFTRDTSMVLIHPAPAPLPGVKPPYCTCLGTRAPPKCRDLPMYAFCGYMKFKHSLFRTTTYELLTENQKDEMHARALLYLERYTRRCTSCGAGCFTRLFGVSTNDGMIRESKQVQLVRKQICALNAETTMTSKDLYDEAMIQEINTLSNYDFMGLKGEKSRESMKVPKKGKRIRSFSSLELENCECLSILLAVYSQVIDHCRAVGQCIKLFDTYMEYIDLSLLNLNIPQAVRLLYEIKESDKDKQNKCTQRKVCKVPWVKEYRTARILTARGACMLESGDYSEARKHLLKAMTYYGLPFPTSRLKVKLMDVQASFNQFMATYVCRKWYVGKESGFTGDFFNNMSNTLCKLYKLFREYKEFDNAALAAKWSLEFAWKSNSSFRILCESYANAIAIYNETDNYSRCHKLERLALDTCFRKRGKLDITEIYSLCILYTSIFMFHVQRGKKRESLQFGLSVIPMISGLRDIPTGQLLVRWILKLLLGDLRIHETVMISRELFYMTDHYDLSSETWYYYYAIVILLDTGLTVEQYGECEKFYIKKGDAILKSKTPEAAWNFFACMWLVTMRVGAWERSILWEEKINQIITTKFSDYEFNAMIHTRLVEGLLISLVNEVNNRNIKKILVLQNYVKTIFQYIRESCDHMQVYEARYLMLYAYFNLMKGKKSKAYKILAKSAAIAKRMGIVSLVIMIEHNRSYWSGTLNPAYVNYWSDHIEPDKLLDYRDFDAEKGMIVPYTLPLPKGLEE